MMRRTKEEQKAYLDGYEMCADCIEKYLSDEGKQKLECLLVGVRKAVEMEDIESEEAQPKQIDNSCLDFDFDKVKEILKKDSLDNLIVDHTCEENKSKSEMKKGEADGK